MVEERIHFCFDFDLTLTKNPPVRGYIPQYKDMIDPDLQKSVFQGVLENHYGSIVSRNESEKIIKDAIIDHVGISPSEFSKMVMVTPQSFTHINEINKNAFIKEAERRHGLKASSKPIITITVLIDDDKVNIRAADLQDILTIQPKHYIEKLNKITAIFRDPKIAFDKSHLETVQRILDDPSRAKEICEQHRLEQENRFTDTLKKDWERYKG